MQDNTVDNLIHKVRNNKETYAYLKLKDGRFVRIQLTKNDLTSNRNYLNTLKFRKYKVDRNAYSKEVVTEYINHINIKSKISKLIFVNEYEQKLYIFEGSAGKWRMYKQWNCSTGNREQPGRRGYGHTATGFDLYIVKATSGTKTGAQIKSEGNHTPICRIHELLEKGQTQPSSNGCVRLSNENKNYIQNTLVKKYPKTRLIIY